jgi:hypothetical protein
MHKHAFQASGKLASSDFLSREGTDMQVCVCMCLCVCMSVRVCAHMCVLTAWIAGTLIACMQCD